MNIEELKLILQTIGQITDGATTAALVWMALHYLSPLFETAMIVVGASGVGIYVARMIISTNEWSELGKSVSRAYGSEPSIFVYTQDRKAIDKAIAKAKEAP